MKITENPEEASMVIEMLRRTGRQRFRGWIVSKLHCCPRSAYWWRTDTPWKPEDLDATQLIFSRGKAHHDILEVYPHKEEDLSLDGVSGRCDMGGDRVFEIFTTTASLSKIETVEDAMRVLRIKKEQLMSYLFMKGGTVGDLMVFFLFGDYSRPITPQLKVYTIECTEEELEKHWMNNLRYIDRIEDCVVLGEPPEEMGEPYECINCGYKYKCVEWLQSRYNLVVFQYLERYKAGTLEDEDVIL